MANKSKKQRQLHKTTYAPQCSEEKIHHFKVNTLIQATQNVFKSLEIF